MNVELVWVGLTTFLSGGLLTGAAAYFSSIRNQLTKDSHKAIYEDKQMIVKVQLDQITQTLVDHGKKLDRILTNGRRPTTTVHRGD